MALDYGEYIIDEPYQQYGSGYDQHNPKPCCCWQE